MPNETLLTAQPRLAFLAAPTPEAQGAREALVALHGDVPPAEADVLVALGGDGFMLQTLHRHATLCKPVYGMKLGTVGFLMNHQRMESLVERLHAAEPAVLRPLEMIVLALTPIAAFRPRRWRGAVLKADTEVRFTVLDPLKRPVSATADSHEVRDAVEVTIRESRDRTVTLLFDPEHNLEERMLAEQFTSG